MPGYIRKKLQEYEHIHPKKPQHCLYSPKPKQFGREAQWPLTGNNSKLLDDCAKKQIQNIVGNILYYARAVNMMVLMVLSTIVMSQAHPTKNTMAHVVSNC
jgi:hypothetical protein